VSELYVVTGGAGFIGSNIVRALLGRNQAVRVFDNFSTGHRDNVAGLMDEVELVEGDLRSIDTCRRAMRGATFVIHQAALPSVPRSIEDPQTTHEVNATGTLNLLVAAREAGVRRIVYASSSSVYGPDGKMPRVETDRPHPVSPYAVSKLCGEHYCAAFFHSYGLETVALRYFNVFGPRQQWDSPYAAVLPRFIRALRRGERPKIFGDGNQSRDFTYIDNVVDANLKALEAAGVPGRVYNAGAGCKTSVNQLLQMLSSTMGMTSEVEYCPPRPGDLRDSLADITRASTDLNYLPSVSVEAGLKTTVAWALGSGA
jgi:UDP-glucose 4-epimerase